MNQPDSPEHSNASDPAEIAKFEAVAHRFSRPGDTIRIDVLLLAPGRWPRHIVNAWQP